MNIFIDTSAILAVLNSADRFHKPAKEAWQELLTGDAVITTSSYILVETIAVLQHRFGTEAVRLLDSSIIPVMDVFWIDENIHHQALSALLAANRRNLSLVDCTSFEIMRKLGLETAFTFDPHFKEMGFTQLPSSALEEKGG